MNSANERLTGLPALAAGLALLGAALAAGCADHGPTNLYSQPLFGQSQAGAHLEVWKVQAYMLSYTAGVSDKVGYVLYLRNTGSGATVGPVHAALAVTSCATVNLATAVFGQPGQVIQPGDAVRGQAVDSAGNLLSSQYAFEATYDLAGCPGATISFAVTATDPYSGAWTSGFTALSQ